MKADIIQCIALTLNPETVKQATLKLTEMSKQPGFCLSTMQIADQQSQNISIRQGALIQFKNSIKKYWNSTQNQISTEQKNTILGSLVQAFIQSSNVNSLLKLYKDIVSTICGFTNAQWLPTQLILNNLNNNVNIIPTLHLIIAIQTNFQIAISENERVFFYQFAKTVYPNLLSFIQRNAHQQVIYLGMKIVWKLVHYEVSHQVRTLLCNWMELILSIVGASNQQLQSKLQQTQDRGTSEFFYFHAKKWATRILYRFLYRHANANCNVLVNQKTKAQNKQFGQLWWSNFGQKTIDIVTKQFFVPTVNKVRFFQLKCLIQLIKNHSNQMKQYSQTFQYQILPEYLKLQPQDQQIANNDPMQWISRQDDYSMNFTYLKKIATQAWISFTNIGAQRKKKGQPQQVGPLFEQNLKYLRSKLEGNNPLQTEMAMFLICKIRTFIESNKQIKSLIPSLISGCIVPHFTSDIMFLRARSMEFFMEYGQLGFDQSIIKKAVEGIYFCLTQDNYPLVRLKAAEAFNILLNHEGARNQVKPLFKQILQIYLVLMEKYQSQNLVYSLTGIVQHFAVQVGPYATQLIKYLSKQFIKLYNKDKSRANDQDYDGQTQLAAAGVLNTMKILLEAPIDKQSIVKMEEDVCDVINCIFGSGDCDYSSDGFLVLKAYTHRMPEISERILFYFPFLIYYVVGIPKQFWNIIPTLPIQERLRNALNQIKSGCQIETLTQVMFVLRNYISLNSGLISSSRDIFGVNLMELLFQMIDQIYQKGPDQYQGQVQMNSSTILMVYLLQNNYQKWDQNILKHIWLVAKFNLLKAKSKVLKAVNAQLLSVFLWNSPQTLLILAQQQNLLNQVFNTIISAEPKIKQQHERQRMILGISTLISMPNKPQQIMSYLPNLFRILIAFINKNCQCRLDDDYEQNYQTESQDQEQQDLNFDADQIQDIWEQDFESNYSSKLDQTDQLKHFRGCIQNLQSQQSILYSQLMKTVTAQQLSNLDQNITKAIQKYSS